MQLQSNFNLKSGKLTLYIISHDESGRPESDSHDTDRFCSNEVLAEGFSGGGPIGVVVSFLAFHF